MQGAPLRILFAAPAWWPAVAFGGPIPVTRELTERLAAHGHEVSVVTTTLVDLHSRPSSQTRTETHGGVRVTYLSTPISYRWMGITPSLPLALERLERPDVVHVLGFRDPISTGVAAWAWLRRIPYVFEPLGMFEPRLRKVPLKRALDATLYRGVAGGAAAVVVSSEREAGHVRDGGVHVDRVRVRGNGFPDPDSMPEGRGVLRGELGIPEAAPIALYVGAHRLRQGNRSSARSGARADRPASRARRARRPPRDDRPGARGGDDRPRPHARTHGGAAAPPVPATRTCSACPRPARASAWPPPKPPLPERRSSSPTGAASPSFFQEGEALVVPYSAAALTDALRRVLMDEALRRSLSAGGVAAARRNSWEHVAAHQEEIYREAIASRQASTKASTEGS